MPGPLPWCCAAWAPRRCWHRPVAPHSPGLKRSRLEMGAVLAGSHLQIAYPKPRCWCATGRDRAAVEREPRSLAAPPLLASCDGRATKRFVSCTWVTFGSARFPLQPAEHRIDQRVDIGVGDRGVVVGDQKPVIEWAVERIEHDVWIEPGTEFASLDPAPDDLGGELAPGLHPALPHLLAQLLVQLRPAKQRPQDLALATTIPPREHPHRRGEALPNGRPLLDRRRPRHLGKERVHDDC